MSLARILLLAIPIGIGVAVAASSDKKKTPTPGGPTGPSGGPPPEPGAIPGWPPGEPRPLPPGPWLDSLEETYTLHREQPIFDAVAAGHFTGTSSEDWITIPSPGSGAYVGFTMQIPVMLDALKIEGVRPTGSFPTTQAVADRLGLLMLTPYVNGLIWNAADAKLDMTTSAKDLTIKQATARTSQMIEASRVVDQKLGPIKAPRDAQGLPTLVGNPGKNWVLTIKYTWPGRHPESNVPHADAGANHGLFRGIWNPLQNVGMAHNLGHVDYSQVMRFMGPKAVLVRPDGNTELVDIAEAMKDPAKAHMVTGIKNKIYGGRTVGEGPLPYARHPKLTPPGTYI